MTDIDAPGPPSLVAPGLLLGIGLGGFVDGIVLHQILQWHHMLSHTERYPTTTLAGLKANTVADGLFHVVAWLAVLTGLILLVRRLRGRAVWSRTSLAGLVVAGWGLFNLVEGVLNHHILGVHHVREGSHALAYDIAFLILGALLLAGGWAVHRRADRAVRAVSGSARATGPR